MEDDTEEGYVQGVTDEVNESNGAQEMYTTSTEVGPGPVRCRGGLAGASIRNIITVIGLFGSTKGPLRYNIAPKTTNELKCGPMPNVMVACRI